MISNAADAELWIVALRALVRTFVTTMICDVLVVWIYAFRNADICHWICIEWNRALFDALSIGIESISILSRWTV